MLNAHRLSENLKRISAAGGVIAICAITAFGASDFWNKKPSSEWSEAEILQMKSKSPWAKKAFAEVMGGGGRGRGAPSGDDAEAGGGGRSGGSGGGGRGGGGGGGRGGGGSEDSGRGGGASTSGIEVIIRWENAKPIVEISKIQLPPAMDNHYAISITGLPPQLITRALSAGEGRGRATEAPVQPEDPAARQKAVVDRLLHSATLTAKGKDPETADLVVQTSDKQSVIFGFLKTGLALTDADKDIQFVMKLPITTIKAKFEPKEMVYKGASTL